MHWRLKWEGDKSASGKRSPRPGVVFPNACILLLSSYKSLAGRWNEVRLYLHISWTITLLKTISNKGFLFTKVQLYPEKCWYMLVVFNPGQVLELSVEFIYSMEWYEQWKWKKVAQLCPTLWDPVDCSLPGPSVHGILQARNLEWVAISFSK